MTYQFINNWRTRLNWPGCGKVIGFYFKTDIFGRKHLLMGFLNFYTFLTWR